MYKGRNMLEERHQRARLRLASTATDVPPGQLIAGMCGYCKKPGDPAAMICMQKPYHTLCFRQAFGFTAVLALPTKQQGKFRGPDLSYEEMRKLLHKRKRRA